MRAARRRIGMVFQEYNLVERLTVIGTCSAVGWATSPPGAPSFAAFFGVLLSLLLGLVGAGGIGVALDAALNNLYWDQVGLILAVIFTVVIFDRRRHHRVSIPHSLTPKPWVSRQRATLNYFQLTRKLVFI